MDENLVKSLTDLIDETIAEIEEIKKSDRFSASEIKIEGPGAGIAGKPSDGKLDKEEDGEEADDAEKAEKKEEDEKEEKDEDKKEEKKEGAKEEPKKEEKGDEGEKKEEMKKTAAEQEEFFKSAIDARVAPLESKLEAIFSMVKELADAPVAPRGVTARMVPLAKSAEFEAAPLSKSEVASKLFELKKSGTPVDTLDITRAEMGSPSDLHNIVSKYNLK
jgi:flagellar biosynthesis GTPase FlhF